MIGIQSIILLTVSVLLLRLYMKYNLGRIVCLFAVDTRNSLIIYD